MCLQSAYTGNQEEAEEFKKEIAEVFPEIEIVQNPLSLSVACHIGHGAIAVACSRKSGSRIKQSEELGKNEETYGTDGGRTFRSI